MKKRILAAVMAVIFTMLQLSVMGPVSQVEAASSVDIDAHNLLEDPGFEDTTKEFVEHGTGSKVDKWSNYKSQVKKVNHDAHTGDWAVELGVTDCSIEQDSADLQIGTTYVAKVWAKVTNDYTTAYFGLKNHGAQEVKVKITSKEYAQYEIPFTYTGASGDNLPRIYVWVESTSGGAAYVDDFELMTESDLTKVSIENGKIIVDYRESYAGTPSKDDFSVVYASSIGGNAKTELPITDATVIGNQIVLSFDKIAAQPLEQVITADVTYLPKNQTVTLDYTVEANGEALVEAEVANFTAENGTAIVVLDKTPTVAPVKADFSLEKSVDGGEYKDVSVTGFNYDAAEKTVTLTFPITNKQPEVQEVSLRLTYKEKTATAAFEIEAGKGTNYYVDATEGSDSNSGTSPETAFKTIEKVNSIEFQPGDQILFQCGEEWTGALKPQGSGIEGAPIVIASYGEGDKPVIKPGPNWTIPYFQPGANSPVRNASVNNGISFYNQEYWEVRDLELYDPTYNPGVESYVYRRGINITAEDCGDLHYFVFDNLTIHGYRGPSDNNGKSSGGIIVTVISDMYNIANRVPSAIHDMTVTNCEMYDLGRSGFNFVSPWTTRTESEWGTFGYRGYGEWKPNTNIYIANNTIYNIDGDGILIDGCKDVLVEHNVVYRTVLNCWYGVGMFNWNSDNTIFQFNEIYDTFPADSYKGAGDAQGIEIDALNRDTWVQYNYVHDNSGGCVMWCNTDDLRGFRGIYRYNIFQNDMTKHGVIDWRTNHKESMAYNNTFYFGELPEGASPRKFMNNGYMNGKSEAKFYNNIFYNLDEFDLNTFNEQEIDWERNIFYGFESVPANDSTVITEDPKFVAPGTGEFGLDSVAGYKLQLDSPAINAGLNIEDNGGRDYFGTPLLDGMTDIGAAEFVAEGAMGIITLHFVDEDGNTLRKDQTLYGLVDDPYTITPADIYGYRFVSMDYEAEGVYTSDKVEVTLVYELYTDKSALQEAVDGALKENGYIPATYAVYLEVLNEAKDILADEKATQEAVDNALEALLEAEKQVISLERLDLYLEVTYPVGAAGYTPGSYADYSAALAEGKTVLLNADATEDELESALDNIIAKKVLLTVVTDLVTVTANKDTYYEWSGATYPLSNILDGNADTKAWIDGAQTVDDWFLFTFAKPVELNNFRIQFADGNDYIYGADVEISADGNTWTKIGVIDNNTDPQLDLTFEAGGATIQYVKITITQTVRNWTQITEASFNYKADDTVDKSALMAAIDEAKALNKDAYSAASWKVVEAALAKAETVNNDKDATAGEVSAAIAALEGSVNALVEKTEGGEVARISGATRYETGYKVADALKAELGVAKFDAVVVATGKNFADALAGSYLAVEKNAPIILTNGKADNIATLHTYIKDNVAEGGKVYILGGEGAVPAEVAAIDGYDVVRLAGKSRYETNLAILAEAGVTGDSIIVATGKAFADSLSASAAKLPILLVKPNAVLSEEAKAIVNGMKEIYIIGGDGAVGADIAAELANFGDVTRISGKSRYETSVAVAETFFGSVDNAVVASGKNFPDGLCGGPLAAAMNAPLILTADAKTDAAAAYMADMGIAAGYVFGGTGALADESVVDVFALESADEIIAK